MRALLRRRLLRMHMPGSCSVAASHVGSAMLGRPVCMTSLAGICARGAVAIKR